MRLDIILQINKMNESRTVTFVEYDDVGENGYVTSPNRE